METRHGLSKRDPAPSAVSVLLAHLRFLVDVPREGDGIVGDLLDVADRVEALFVVGCRGPEDGYRVSVWDLRSIDVLWFQQTENWTQRHKGRRRVGYNQMHGDAL